MIKQFYKKINLLVFLLVAGTLSFAQTFVVDGIKYNVLTGTSNVEVVAQTPEYNGDITIPATVTNINQTYSVTQIGVAAFANCGLTSIVIPNSIIHIKMAAFYKTSLTNVIIPNSVINIESQAFISCTQLTSINIPNSVTSIGDKVFAGCSLVTSIKIPTSVTSLGDSIFWLCTGLNSLIVNRNNPLIITKSKFQEIYTTATLYVPTGSKTAYQNDAVWGKFANIVEYTPTGTESLNSLEANINIFPNPASENITISFNEYISGIVSIIDSKGNVVLTKAIAGNSSNISTTELASGVYVVKISTEKGVVVKQMVVR